MILGATGWDVLWSLLPFLFLLGFWLYLSRNYRGRTPPDQDALLQKLDEIHEEIRRLRKAIEERQAMRAALGLTSSSMRASKPATSSSRPRSRRN